MTKFLGEYFGVGSAGVDAIDLLGKVANIVLILAIHLL